MSLGGMIGAVAGGVIGFIVGGPVGAAVGAGIGMGIGMILDPATPDVQPPGDPGTVTVNYAKEGSVIVDLLGTTKLNGNIVWSCCERSQEVKEEVEAGKGGGSQEVSKGFEYFLTWIVNFGLGPIDTLYTIYANDLVVWSGALPRSSASSGMVSITLTGMGDADFYFGTADQVASSYVGAKLANSNLNPGYRGQAYLVLKDCKLGSYNRAPSIFIVAKKAPSFDELTDDYREIETYDYNPAFALWYILNKAINLGVEYLEDSEFDAIAMTLKGEARGISMKFESYQEAQTYIEMLLNHISGGVRWTGDAKLLPFLFRKHPNPDELAVFNPEDLVDVPKLSRPAWIDTKNDVKIQYTKRVFREPVCPSGCDGFEVLDYSYIEQNETHIFRIKNPQWTTTEGCSDNPSFLSDGMPDDLKGEFFNLVPVDLANGIWEFAYRASSRLCAGQDPDVSARVCPIICGYRLPCCDGCRDPEPLTVDWDLTAQVVTGGGSAILKVEGGCPPYDWEITEGTGFSLVFDKTEDGYNQITAVGGVCGFVEIRTVDSCNQSLVFTVRTPSGAWVLDVDEWLNDAHLLANNCYCYCGEEQVTLGGRRYASAWAGGTNIVTQYGTRTGDPWDETPWPMNCHPDYNCGCPGFEYPFAVVEERPTHRWRWSFNCS